MPNLTVQRFIYKYCVQKPRVSRLLSRLGASTTLNKAILHASPDPLESQVARQRLLSSPSPRAQWAVYDHEIGGRTRLDKIQHFMFDIKPGEPASVVLGMTMGGQVPGTVDFAETERTAQFIRLADYVEAYTPSSGLSPNIWRLVKMIKLYKRIGRNDKAQELRETAMKTITDQILTRRLQGHDEKAAFNYIEPYLAYFAIDQIKENWESILLAPFSHLIRSGKTEEEVRHILSHIVELFLGPEKKADIEREISSIFQEKMASGEKKISLPITDHERYLISVEYVQLLISQLEQGPIDLSRFTPEDIKENTQERLGTINALLQQDPIVASKAREEMLKAHWATEREKIALIEIEEKLKAAIHEKNVATLYGFHYYWIDQAAENLFSLIQGGRSFSNPEKVQDCLLRVISCLLNKGIKKANYRTNSLLKNTIWCLAAINLELADTSLVNFFNKLSDIVVLDIVQAEDGVMAAVQHFGLQKSAALAQAVEERVAAARKAEEEKEQFMLEASQKIREIAEAIEGAITERLNLGAGGKVTVSGGFSGAYGLNWGGGGGGGSFRLEHRHELRTNLLPKALEIERGDTIDEAREMMKALNFLVHHEVCHLIPIKIKFKLPTSTSFNARKIKAQAKEAVVDKLAFEAARTIFVYTGEDSELNEQDREAIAIEAHLTLSKIILRNLEAGKHTLPDECIVRLAVVQLELAGSQAISSATRDEINRLAAVFLARVNKKQEEIDQLVDAYRQIFRSVRLPD